MTTSTELLRPYLEGKKLNKIEKNKAIKDGLEVGKEIEEFAPNVAIIDSIQALNDENLSSASGSVAQVRECSAALQRVAKNHSLHLHIYGDRYKLNH